MGILFHVTYAATVYTQAVMKQWKQDLFCRPSLALNDIKSRWSPHFKFHCTTMASACVSHLLSHCHPCRSGNYCALDSWGARSIRGSITLRHTLGGACLLCDLSDLPVLSWCLVKSMSNAIVQTTSRGSNGLLFVGWNQDQG